MAVGLTLRGLTLASGAVVVAAAGAIDRRCGQSAHRLPVRLRDVGDAWRALLLGAPPALL